MLRIAAVATVANAVLLGALLLYYSGETRPWLDQDPSAFWMVVDESTSTRAIAELVFDESLVASANVVPQEVCRLHWRASLVGPAGITIHPNEWFGGIDGTPSDPIERTLQELRSLNPCNTLDPSTLKTTGSTWDTAHAIVQARGAPIIKTCEPGCVPDDHTKAWTFEVRGSFVAPESHPGRAFVPDAKQVAAPPGSPIAGTWYSIIPVLDY